MIDEGIASRSFHLNDQIAFARLSSDWNPMHLDPAFARRTQFGAPIVHGIHNLAWAADAVLRSFPIKVASLRATFLQPLYLDEPAHVRIRNRTDSQIQFEVIAAGTAIALVTLSSRPSKFAVPIASAASAPRQFLEPADLSFDQLGAQAGSVEVGEADLRSVFPALSEAIGPAAVRALLATSQIVGMACPGTALAVRRSCNQLRSEKPSRRRALLRRQQHRRAIPVAANRRRGLRYRRPARGLRPSGSAVPAFDGRDIRAARGKTLCPPEIAHRRRLPGPRRGDGENRCRRRRPRCRHLPGQRRRG